MVDLASDNFDRADSTDLGAAWTPITTGQLHIVSNEVLMASVTSIKVEYYSAIAPWPDDQFSQAKVAAYVATTSGGLGVTVRVGGTTYYAGGKYTEITPANGNRRIFKQAGGVRTGIATEAVDLASGDIVRLVASGSNISLFVNTSLSCEAVDSAIATGSAGIWIRTLDTTGASDHKIDNWLGGDFSSVAVAFFPFRLMMLGVR